MCGLEIEEKQKDEKIKRIKKRFVHENKAKLLWKDKDMEEESTV